MSDRERFRRGLLDLITRPGVVEIVIALHEHEGSATLAELQAAGISRPAPLLRSLAVAGQVCRPSGGTWDTPPSPDERFVLTAAGVGLATTLGEIENWGRQHLSTTRGRARCQRGRSSER
jgi:DNA-binding HxlR family transcriptional regulator